MNLEEEIEALRRHLKPFARGADGERIERYELKRQPVPPGLYWRMRWLAGWVVRWLEAARIWRVHAWAVSPWQANNRIKAKPFLVWSVGVDGETLRIACEGLPGWGLVVRLRSRTRYGRAGFRVLLPLDWLVEYLPRVDGEGECYERRKARFLARPYKGALALPLSISLEKGLSGG